MNNLDAILNKKIKVEYYDHNENFGEYLPRDGVLKKRYATSNVDDWYLFKLDEPFKYGGIIQRHFLIRSKWVGEVINDKEKCAVFILLIPDMKYLNKNVINVKNFEHVAWGFATII